MKNTYRLGVIVIGSLFGGTIAFLLWLAAVLP